MKKFWIILQIVIDVDIIQKKRIIYIKDLQRRFILIARGTENTDASRYRASKLKQRLIMCCLQLFFVLRKRNVGEIVYAENLDSSWLPGESISLRSETNDDDRNTEEEEDELNDDQQKPTFILERNYNKTNEL